VQRHLRRLITNGAGDPHLVFKSNRHRQAMLAGNIASLDRREAVVDREPRELMVRILPTLGNDPLQDDVFEDLRIPRR
jgi:hypothetical protein